MSTAPRADGRERSVFYKAGFGDSLPRRHEDGPMYKYEDSGEQPAELGYLMPSKASPGPSPGGCVSP